MKPKEYYVITRVHLPNGKTQMYANKVVAPTQRDAVEDYMRSTSHIPQESIVGVMLHRNYKLEYIWQFVETPEWSLEMDA